MDIATIKKDSSVTPPCEVLKFFPSTTELAVWSKGDTIVL
jgi:hypothetical protein